MSGVALPSWQKNKDALKYTPKGDISGITEKDDIHPRFILFLLRYHIHWHPRKGQRSSHRRCSTSKGVLRNFDKFTGKDLCQGLFFNKATDWGPETLFKKKLWPGCFPVNFGKFLRTRFLQNTPRQLLLEFELFSVLLWKPL